MARGLFVVAYELPSSGVWVFFSLSSCGAWAQGHVGSVVVAHRVQSAWDL